MTVAPALKAFLDLIAFSEGTSTGLDNGYGVIVSGVDGAHTFTDYSTHPFANGRLPIAVNNEGLRSTASGRYQQVVHNWRIYKLLLKLPDFGHESQDTMAIQEIKECGGLEMIADLKIADAIRACASRWASFPGAYKQGRGPHSMEELLEKYAELNPNYQVESQAGGGHAPS